MQIFQNAYHFARTVIVSSSKEAWDTLQKKLQESGKIKTIALQNLKNDFGNLSMESRENINDYYKRITDLVDQMRM